MAIYKNYIIKTGDTIEHIAKQYLGSGTKASQIISLNRLRYPYIVETTSDKYGPIKGRGVLLNDLPINSVSLNISDYIANKTINPLILTPKSLMYLRANTASGSFSEDTLVIDNYYAQAQNSISAGTLTFSPKKISAPTQSAESLALLQVSNQCTFTATFSDTGNPQYLYMNVTSVKSGYLSVGMNIASNPSLFSTKILFNKQNNSTTYSLTGTGLTGTYLVDKTLLSSVLSLSYFLSWTFDCLGTIPSSAMLTTRLYHVQFSYIFYEPTNTTLASPLSIDPITGMAMPFAVQTYNALPQLLVFRPPDEWPTGATGVNVYVGIHDPSMTSDSLLNVTYQTTLYSSNELYVEPISMITNSGVSVPQYNSAYIGTGSLYPKGTQFFFYENPEQFNTQVVKPGDVLLLPLAAGRPSTSIIAGKRSAKFRSALGSDIALNASGHIDIDNAETGDMNTVEGIANVKQALLARLSTAVGTFKTRPSFGNKAMSLVGAKYSPMFLTEIKTELADTLRAEKRVYAVHDFSVYYQSKTSAIIVQNLNVEIIHDGQSSSIITFEPIALPV